MHYTSAPHRYHISAYRPQGKKQRDLISRRTSRQAALLAAEAHSKFCHHLIVVDYQRDDGEMELIAQYRSGELYKGDPDRPMMASVKPSPNIRLW